MITRNNITEVAYNVQTTVDAENKLLIDYNVTNSNDSKAMGTMLQRAKSILRTNRFTALYDKGYHTGSEFKIAEDLHIDTLVAIPNPTVHAPDPAYDAEKFTFISEGDYYLCPQDQILTTTGKWHHAPGYRFKRYATRACISCQVKDLCSKSARGKGIHRSEYHKYIEHNKERVERNKELYRRRQAIVEHPNGTLKRQWGFSYIMTKRGSDRASSDVGLMLTAYNLRRIMNILGAEHLRRYLMECGCLISKNMTVWKRKLAPILDFLKAIRNVNPESDLLVYRMQLTKTTI